MNVNPHHSLTLRYNDNIFLGVTASVQYTGLGGAVRQGLTHMAIPRGWTWGGPASEHCPVWCEIYTQSPPEKEKETVQKPSPIANGTCMNVEDLKLDSVKMVTSTPNGKCISDI